jgi:phytoene synthase
MRGSIEGVVRPVQQTADFLSEPSLDAGSEDARACQRLVTRHARTFSMASRLLPPDKRRGVFAVYATCRTADDLVDVAANGTPADALRRFRNQAFRALHERSDNPILRELARAWHRFDVPDESLHELFAGLELDLLDRSYDTWSDLESYCQGVAGSVGAMCCAVFGVAADLGQRRSAVVTSARTLGVAMQLTNILRDVGEDARRGRCYLPVDELRQFGFDRGDVLSGSIRNSWSAWRGLMRVQVARARDLYRQAMPGIAFLQRDARRCAFACATGYARILDAIEGADYDTFSQRVAASRLTLFGVAWRSWRGTLVDDVSRQAPG